MATVDEILRWTHTPVDDAWMKDTSYPTCVLYGVLEYVPVANKRIADFSNQISVRGEQNYRVIGFVLPRYDGAVDLTAQNLYIHYQTMDNGGDSRPCNVEYSSTHIRLCWMIPVQATYDAGSIQMLVYATGNDANRIVWKTLPASYPIHDGLDVGGNIPEPDRSWYEQFVLQMESKVASSQEYANEAKASQDAAASSATACAQTLGDTKAYVESQKAAFVGYSKRNGDLRYANALIGLVSGVKQVVLDDTTEAPLANLDISGNSEQVATTENQPSPSPDSPQDIKSTGGGGGVTITVTNSGQSQNVTIPLATPLHGIGDYQDRIMCKSGTWGIERQIGKIDNNQWGINNIATGGVGHRFVVSPNGIVKTNNATVLCSKYQHKKINSYNNAGDYIATDELQIGRVHIRTRDTDFSSTAAFRAFMADAVTIYPLATPIWEPLPAETQAALNALTTYTGATTIAITADGPSADIAVEYIQDTRKIVADLQEQINELRNSRRITVAKTQQSN